MTETASAAATEPADVWIIQDHVEEYRKKRGTPPTAAGNVITPSRWRQLDGVQRRAYEPVYREHNHDPLTHTRVNFDRIRRHEDGRLLLRYRGVERPLAEAQANHLRALGRVFGRISHRDLPYWSRYTDRDGTHWLAIDIRDEVDERNIHDLIGHALHAQELRKTAHRIPFTDAFNRSKPLTPAKCLYALWQVAEWQQRTRAELQARKAAIRTATTNAEIRVARAQRLDDWPEPPAEPSNDASLETLTVQPDAGEVTAVALTEGGTAYTVEVAASTKRVTVTATATHDGATVTVEGGSPATLTGAKTRIRIRVQAEDGTEQTYALTVRRAAA